MAEHTCPKCGHPSDDAAICPDCGQALVNGTAPRFVKPPPPPEAADWVIEPIPPELMAWAQEPIDEEELAKDLREAEAAGWPELKDLIAEIEQEMRSA